VKTVKTKIVLTCLVAVIALLAVNGELVGLPKKNDTAIVGSLEDGRSGEMRFRSYHPTRQELARGVSEAITPPGKSSLAETTGKDRWRSRQRCACPMASRGACLPLS
jgi:hypothetical protein